MVGAHQQTTCDLARVIATYSSRSHSPASSSAQRRQWSAQSAPPPPTLRQRCPSSSWNSGRVGFGHEPVGDGGQVDDGVLQALAGVDRHQLHRGGVGVEPPGALDAAAGPALGDLLAQPGQQRHQAVPLGERDLVQRLADVAQVGEPAVAADLGEHPRGQPGDVGGLEHRGDAAGGEQLDPGAQRLGDVVGQVVAARVELRGGVAEEAGERARPHSAKAVDGSARTTVRSAAGSSSSGNTMPDSSRPATNRALRGRQRHERPQPPGEDQRQPRERHDRQDQRPHQRQRLDRRAASPAPAATASTATCTASTAAGP